MKKFFQTNPLTINEGETITQALKRMFDDFYFSHNSNSFASFRRHYYLWKASQSTVVPGAQAA